jgi:hypothetical protein
MLPSIIMAIILAVSPVCKTDPAPIIFENTSGVPVMVICHEERRQQTWHLDNYDWRLVSNHQMTRFDASDSQR